MWSVSCRSKKKILTRYFDPLIHISVYKVQHERALWFVLLMDIIPLNSTPSGWTWYYKQKLLVAIIIIMQNLQIVIKQVILPMF